MPLPKDHTETVSVTDFKAKCLTMIDDIARGRKDRVVLTKHNKAIAAVVPLDDALEPLWGSMKGTVTIAEGTDLTEPTGEVWEANG